MPLSTSSGSVASIPGAGTGTRRHWPRLTLYGDLNMRPIRNAWMLEEIGLPYEHRAIRPWSRAAKSVHPLGKVPALSVEYERDGGDNEARRFVLVESAAINTFIGDLAREISATSAGNGRLPTLVPPPATPLRAKYDSLVMFVMTELDSQSLWIHRKHHDLADVFGEAPTAVREARRQFDSALDAMVAEIDGSDSGDEDRYLLPTGFSAADILFANCCFWAQQSEWLEKKVADDPAAPSAERQADEKNEAAAITPKPLVLCLASYLKRCRSRPAFMKANELRKNQVFKKKEGPASKL